MAAFSCADRVGAKITPAVEAAAADLGQRDEHVVERRIIVEQIHDLERPRDPALRDLPRRESGDRFAGEDDLAAIRAVTAGQHVEAGRLARAVRAHDPRQTTFVESERDVFEHDLPAESLVQVSCLEERHQTLVPATARAASAPLPARLRCQSCHSPAMPSGFHSTIPMNSSPYQRSHVSV